MKIELTVTELKELSGPHNYALDFETKSNAPLIEPQYLKRPAGSDVVPGVVDEIIFHLYRGEKVNAIKRYKERYNVGLKEAKDAVDGIQDALAKFFP